MNISIIVAVSNNWAIGKNNDMLWYLPKDFLFFKKHTVGKPIVMGKNTWNSLPFKPLPQRDNYILSQTINDQHLDKVYICRSIEILQGYINKNSTNPQNEIMIIGGAKIYQQFLPICNKLYLTTVDASFEADTYFPAINLKEWQLEYTESHPVDDKHKYSFKCNIYNKIKNNPTDLNNFNF